MITCGTTTQKHIVQLYRDIPGKYEMLNFLVNDRLKQGFCNIGFFPI
jgi:hypothetical protein